MSSDSIIGTIGLDADDTLWHSEVHFVEIEGRFRELIGSYVSESDVDARLLETERRNLAVVGYGVKSFALSMIETAIELTDSRVRADDIHKIIGWAHEMMTHPIDLLPGVAETIDAIVDRYHVLIITKGDLFHQEAKIAESGLGDIVHGAEIVSEKDPATYQELLARRGIDPQTFLMVGNSLKSDVLPVVEIGGHAAHIPYHVITGLEAVATDSPDRYHALNAITEVPDLAATIR